MLYDLHGTTICLQMTSVYFALTSIPHSFKSFFSYRTHVRSIFLSHTFKTLNHVFVCLPLHFYKLSQQWPSYNTLQNCRCSGWSLTSDFQSGRVTVVTHACIYTSAIFVCLLSQSNVGSAASPNTKAHDLGHSNRRSFPKVFSECDKTTFQSN